jgi:hypothetical protein
VAKSSENNRKKRNFESTFDSNKEDTEEVLSNNSK